ncbi:MAG: tetratricopeptide repeat protein [Desulforegulaceae bacterium]|nr:tetratricopeptide repeat protein [Desulforegulaceae bacterium]
MMIKKILSFFYLKADKILVLSAAFFFISSCSFFVKPQTEQINPSSDTTRTQDFIIPEGNSYFNYIVSEIESHKKNNQKSFEYLVKAQQKDPDSKYLKKQLAKKLLLYKKTQPAKEIISALMEEDPKDPEILSLFAGILALEKKDPNEILEIYEKIIDLDPENKKAPIALAFLYEKLNKRQKLIETFEKAALSAKHNYFLYFYLGEAYLLDKQYSQARKNFYKAAKEEPYRIEPKLSLIETIKNLRKTHKHKKEIIDLFNEIIELKPNDPTLLIELSYFYYQNGDYEKSDETFKAVGEEWNLNKQNIAAILNFYSNNNFNDKSDFTAMRIFQATGDSSIFLVLGSIYNKADQTKKAVETYKLVPETSSLHSNAIAAISIILAQTDKFEEAVSLIKKQTAKKPEDLILISALGNLYEEKKDYENAQTFYQKGASIESEKKWTFFYRLGVINDKAGKKDKSLEYMKKALDLEPENPDILNYIGYTYAEMDINLELAKEMIEKALMARKDDGYITDSLGWVYYKLGNYEKAEFFLEKASKITKNDPVILEHLAELYIKTGRQNLAVEIYENILKTDPDNAEVKKKLMKIKEQ